VYGLWLTNTPLNVVVFIGLIMLCGIVVNNAIVLVDRINQLRRQGVDKDTAILDAAKTRLRPIVMTTLTTVLGLLPMAFGFGEGAEIRTPMAITVIYGLLFASLLTLILLPVLYSLFDVKKNVAQKTSVNTNAGFGDEGAMSKGGVL
jgi:multidrug efflux pump subunit AcrB